MLRLKSVNFDYMWEFATPAEKCLTILTRLMMVRHGLWGSKFQDKPMWMNHSESCTRNVANTMMGGLRSSWCTPEVIDSALSLDDFAIRKVSAKPMLVWVQSRPKIKLQTEALGQKCQISTDFNRLSNDFPIQCSTLAPRLFSSMQSFNSTLHALRVGALDLDNWDPGGGNTLI